MRWWKLTLIILAVALAAAQFIRPERTNPPVDPRTTFAAQVKPPAGVAEILARGCGDCHSYETVWPAYSKFAPVSWLVASDVSEGRGKLNLSLWSDLGPERNAKRFKDMCDLASSGEMAPWYYRTMHPKAKLSAGDVAAICALAK